MTGSWPDPTVPRWWLAGRLAAITVREVAAGLVRVPSLRPAAVWISVGVLVAAVLGLSRQAAITGEQLRVTGLGPALGPVLALVAGSVWAYVVLWRLLTSPEELARGRRRLALLPIPGHLLTPLAALPVLLPLAVASLAAATPLTVLLHQAGVTPTAALVPLLTGMALSSAAFFLARWVLALAAAVLRVRREPRGWWGPVALALLLGAYAAGVAPVLATGDPLPTSGTLAPADAPLPEASPVNPVLTILLHDGPWSPWQLTLAALAAALPLVALATLRPDRLNLQRRPVPGPARYAVTPGPGRRTVTYGPARRRVRRRAMLRTRPFLGVVSAVATLVRRSRALVTDLAVCTAVGLGIAAMALVLARQDRGADTALFAFWAAAFPALGLVTLRAALGPTQRLLGLGLRGRDLALALTLVLLGLWVLTALPAAVLLREAGDGTLLVRHAVVALGSVLLAASAGTLTRGVVLGSSGRGLTVGAALAALVLLSAMGAPTWSTPVLLSGCAVLAAGWVSVTALTTRRTTVDLLT